MCTLTFTANDEGFILTSNRDEQRQRATHSPNKFTIRENQVIMPIDAVAGGTWIGTSSSYTACLLNGGYVGHSKLDYKNAISRGNIIRELFESIDPYCFLIELNCQNFEPFTLVVIKHKEKMLMWEFVWDGNQKFLKIRDTHESYIWSSSTLYSSEIKMRREELFYRSLSEAKLNRPSELIAFHCSTPFGDEQGFRIKRESGVETVSVSQISVSRNQVKFTYLDLLNSPLEKTWILEK